MCSVILPNERDSLNVTHFKFFNFQAKFPISGGSQRNEPAAKFAGREFGSTGLKTKLKNWPDQPSKGRDRSEQNCGNISLLNVMVY
jgi:hypothetical protein